ncbi:hypothetical protein [Salinibacter altiplanensis]|uniref:hypothetical protein n=1 Tax=Salinibacter altiplanensis TaxID=1803181 RepID=UPI000C9FD3CA|nr:hypothetical protein [Salinibacter altiplanensis]
MSLDEVERPADAEQRFGETEVSETDTSYVFEDQFIRAVVAPTGSFTLMSIENKTDNTVRIDWNQGVFVGPDGSSQTLVHGEMRRMDIGREVSPTVIGPRAAVEKIVSGDEEVDGAEKMPTTRVAQNSESQEVKKSLRENAESLVGKSFEILMPFKIEGTINEYIFRIGINEASLETVQ